MTASDMLGSPVAWCAADSADEIWVPARSGELLSPARERLARMEGFASCAVTWRGAEEVGIRKRMSGLGRFGESEAGLLQFVPALIEALLRHEFTVPV